MNQQWLHARRVLGIFAGVLCISSCKDATSSGGAGPDRGTLFAARSIALDISDTTTLEIPLQAAGSAVPADVSWRTSDSTVATVSTNGVLKARRAGNIVVYARRGNATDSTRLRVAASSPRAFSEIAVGTVHACARDVSGGAWCWGGSTFGELGMAPRALGSYFVTPQRVNLPGAVVTLTTGTNHTCWLTDGGAVYCHGDNRLGQVTGAAGSSVLAPRQVPLPERISAIDAGGDQTCGLSVSGAVHCWGSGFTRFERATAPGGAAFTTLSVGVFHRCATTAQRDLYCWGQNSFGQLGVASAGGELRAPTLVPVRATSVSAGATHTCAVTDTGSAFCWGYGGQGQLGTGSTAIIQPTPAAVVGTATFQSVAAGTEHTCALDRDGAAWCWGLDVRGGVGRGMIPNGNELLNDLIIPTPQRVATALRFRGIAVGAMMSTCAVTLAEQHAWCWGNNSSGVLGIGSRRRISAVLSFSSTVSPALVNTGAVGLSF